MSSPLRFTWSGFWPPPTSPTFSMETVTPGIPCSLVRNSCCTWSWLLLRRDFSFSFT